MALPCVNFDVNQFVDREAETMRLEQIVSFSVDQKSEEKPSDYQRVIHLVGKSNVGKTFLLCNYGKYLEEKKILRVGLSFVNFLDFSGSEFVKHIVNSLYDQIVPYVVGQPGNRFDMESNALSQLFVKELGHLEKKSVIVFLLDEVSMLSENQVELLEDYLLADIVNLPNVIVVLSGRNLRTGWKEFALRPLEEVNVVELSGFDFDYSQKQIRAINPLANDFVGEIHEFSGGSPGNNRKIVEQLGDPPQFNELNAIRACNQEFYTVLDSKRQGLPQSTANELLPALQALCVLQDFDKEYEMPEMLSVHPDLNGIWTVQRCSDLLNILSSIQVGPGKLIYWDLAKSALTIEEQTRFNLEKELMIRDVDLWKTLHCTAMKMYSDWAVLYGMDSIYADKAEHHKSQLIHAGVDPETCG